MTPILNPLAEQRNTQRWFPVYNNSGEEVPAYGCMVIEDATRFGTEGVVTITKPTAAAEGKTPIIFNGPAAIPNGKYGSGTTDTPAWGYSTDAAADPDDRTQVFGMSSGSWKLVLGKTGYKLLGVHPTEDLILVQQYGGGGDAIAVKVTSATPDGDDFYPCNEVLYGGGDAADISLGSEDLLFLDLNP